MPNQKHILIIYPVDFNQEANLGIKAKMEGQGEAFAELGYVVSQAFIRNKKCIFKIENKESVLSFNISSKLAKYQSLYTALTNKLTIITYDLVYIRHLVHTRSLLSFLKAVDKSKTKIIYEFPTYPYYSEWYKWWQRLLLIEDSLVRSRCEIFIDLIIHFGGYDGNLKAKEITNGVLLKTVEIFKNQVVPNNNTFRLVAVGRWEYWHGLERILYGMMDCTENIALDIIGHGPKLGFYKKIVATNNNIKNKVVFHGPLHGKLLERIMANANLGVGTLGLHRKDVMMDSSLKHRMYCAFGLPFVFAGEDANFNIDLPFIFRVPVGESKVNLDSLIGEYTNKKAHNPNGLAKNNIITYATKNLSWKSRIIEILREVD
ncbi:MAG: glycosyltransferase [Saprospiraceae bacterium]